VGTWSAFGSGRVLVGVDTGDSDFDTVEETGGSKTHTLTTSEMPAHKHDWALSEYDGPYDYGTGGEAGNVAETTDGRNRNMNTETVGGGSAHNNVQPYITVYMWKRTA
jgi:microcystin-dependent protein